MKSKSNGRSLERIRYLKEGILIVQQRCEWAEQLLFMCECQSNQTVLSDLAIAKKTELHIFFAFHYFWFNRCVCCWLENKF